MKRLGVIGALGGLALAAGAARSAEAPPALTRVLVAQERTPYEGRVRAGQSVLEVAADGQGRSLQRFFDLSGRSLGWIVSDGRQRWHYQPGRPWIAVSPVEPHAEPERRAALARRNYRTESLGASKLASRPVWGLRLVPRYPGSPIQTIWADRQTGFPLGIERRAGDGGVLDRVVFEKVSFPKRLPASRFAFAAPEGTRVEAAATVLAQGDARDLQPAGLPFTAVPPRYVPPGYALSSWQLFQDRGKVPTFCWRYHDGLAALSLYAVSVAHMPHAPGAARAVKLASGTEARWLGSGPERTLMWRTEHAAYTLVGALSQAEFLKIAATAI